MRIGFASDIHRLLEGRRLILCGIVIPSEKGEEAHSDGDVVFHAVGESILGALALGDLGKFFPDSDARYKDMDSSILIKEIVRIMKEKNYFVNNVDVSITLETPKLRNYIDSMRENLARLLEVDVDRVSIKAGTNEQLDAVGRGEAVKAESYISLFEKGE